MSNNELKSCPFPHIEGAGQYMAMHERSRGLPFQAHCLICGARGPVAETKEKAITAWNNMFKEGITTGIHYNLPISEIKLQFIAKILYEEKFGDDYKYFNPFWQGIKKGFESALKQMEVEDVI